jgi:hypothetical protein
MTLELGDLGRRSDRLDVWAGGMSSEAGSGFLDVVSQRGSSHTVEPE